MRRRRASGRSSRIATRVNKPRVRETLCFAGVFLVVHFVMGLIFEHTPSRDAAPASSGSEVAAELLVQSVITVSLAAPAYFVLMSWYRRFDSKRKGSAAGDEK